MPAPRRDFSELLPQKDSWRVPRQSRMDALRVNVGDLWCLHTNLPSFITDLLDLAVAVYVVDRLTKRARRNGHWQPRDLALQLPVSDPDLWTPLIPELSSLLHWLTTDTWELSFVGTVTSRRSRPVGSLYPPELDRPFVGLYSGGLDSLAGAVAQAMDPANASGVLVGSQSSGRLKGLQLQHLETLQRRIPDLHWEPFRGFQHRSLPKRLHDWKIPEQQQEKSQRSRAFLFLVFGAVTAYAYGAPTLHVYENGVGAINLPYSAAFGGADHTRAMHPRTLQLVSGLFSRVFGRPFQVINASIWKTKGQMCTELANHGLGDLAHLTVSCDSFPLREVHQQCGLCTSCLLRRLSLCAGGLRKGDAAANLYRDDIFDLAPAAADRLGPYQFMLEQAQTFERLTLSESFVDFRLEFDVLEAARSALAVTEGWTPAEVDVRLRELYRRYALEFRQFDQAVRSSALVAGQA
jgi:hypothetical protein